MKTLSVAFGDSSPKGRAKGLLQIGAAKKKRRAGQAPPLRYDETRDSSEITTFPLISRFRRQLPPEGKPFGCGGTGRLIVYAS